MTTHYRHQWTRGEGRDSIYRVCRECRVVQRKVSGKWVGGSQAANPTEQKNIARRLIGAGA